MADARAVWKPAPVTLALAAGAEDAVEGGRARRDVDLGGGGGEAARLGVVERPERGHVLAVHRRHARDLHGVVGHPPQRVGRGVVAGDRPAPAADPDGGRDVEVVGAVRWW